MTALLRLITPQEPLHEQRGWVVLTYQRPGRKSACRVGYQIPYRLLCTLGSRIDPESVCLYTRSREVFCINQAFVRKVATLPDNALPGWAHELERDWACLERRGLI